MDLQTFTFDGATVRAVEIDGDPYLVGKDVAERLGYANPADAIRQHCKGVVKRYPLQTAGGLQEVRVLAEPDVLRLIVKSNLPAAERFERLVFEEILPTIRRTGSYGAPAVDPMAVLNDPAAMRGLLLGYTERVLELEGRVADMAPRAEAYDRIATADGSLCITDAAKAMQVRPKELFAYLRLHHRIYRRPGTSHDLGYQAKVQAGYLEHKVKTLTLPDGTERISEQVRVTPKGLAKLAAIFGKAEAA